MVDNNRVFVTVGTTQFDDLLETTLRKDTVDILVRKGYNHLILQKGRGKFSIDQHEIDDARLKVECYDFKSSIAKDLEQASLVISHAGAGSILETLALKKPLIVVVNESLMDNHQYELAEKMAEQGYLYYCTCQTLQQTLSEKDLKKLKEMPAADPRTFANYVDRVMGIES